LQSKKAAKISRALAVTLFGTPRFLPGGRVPFLAGKFAALMHLVGSDGEARHSIRLLSEPRGVRYAEYHESAPDADERANR
jgi:hypothetical protein